jgi:hypothetical protein
MTCLDSFFEIFDIYGIESSISSTLWAGLVYFCACCNEHLKQKSFSQVKQTAWSFPVHSEVAQPKVFTGDVVLRDMLYRVYK